MGREVYQVEIDRLMQQPKHKELVESISDTPARRYLELAINTTKLRKQAFESVSRILSGHEKQFQFNDSAPFAIFSKEDPTKIIVYPNIPRTIDAALIAEHTVQMWTDGRSRKKIEDVDRASNYAMKREVTSVGKFLGKHSNLSSIGYKDDQVRSLCEKLAVQNRPPEIIVCESPEDYHTMFKVKTGSCMEVGSSYWGTWSHVSLPKIAEDTGIFMAAWYHYVPWCCGAYVMVQGKPIARFMIYKSDVTSEKYDQYGDVRGSSIAYKEIIDKWVADQGYKPLQGYARSIADFRVPGITHPLLEEKHKAGDLFCPLPNMDKQAKDYDVCFDKDTGEFVFYPRYKGKCACRSITDTYEWEGFIPSSAVPIFKDT